MKNWTNSIALALMAATLTLAGCTDDGPGPVSAVPEPEPGDPAIYAPDGWPLQIGDRISRQEKSRLYGKFKTPGFTWSTRRAPTSGLHLVGGRVYAPVFQRDLSKVGEYATVYRGHFRVRLPESMREQEPDLPPEFHGRIEYYTPRARQPRQRQPELTPEQIREFEACFVGITTDREGRVIKPPTLPPPCPQHYVPRPPDPLAWPDYPERRK